MTEPWRYSPEVISKARTLLDTDKVIRDRSAPNVFWVQGSASRPYRVQTDATRERARWINCTCPHGMNLGAGQARCSHAVAVLIAIRDDLVLASYPEA